MLAAAPIRVQRLLLLPRTNKLDLLNTRSLLQCYHLVQDASRRDSALLIFVDQLTRVVWVPDRFLPQFYQFLLLAARLSLYSATLSGFLLEWFHIDVQDVFLLFVLFVLALSSVRILLTLFDTADCFLLCTEALEQIALWLL